MSPAVAETTTKPSINGISSKYILDDIPSCIQAFANGEFLVVLDSPTRENEGDLIISAAHMTPAKIAFMIRYTSGFLCAPISAARARELDLPLMVPLHTSEDPHRTAYTVTVDGLGEGVTTGISAHDRCVTVRFLADPNAGKSSFRKPGHVLPLVVREGGVRIRRGHTEAAWEFARLAGIETEATVLAEMVIDGEFSEDGRPELVGGGMMRLRDCVEFGRQWGIKVCTIEDLVKYVEETEGVLGATRERADADIDAAVGGGNGGSHL